METLLVAQHKNQCYGRTKPRGPVPARCGSSPSKNFREINCRTFYSGSAILTNPFAVTSYSTPVIKSVSTLLPKTPSSPASSASNVVRNTPGTAPISFAGKRYRKESIFIEPLPNGSRSLAEWWAGPAYSKSPPPSCLPIPKFSLQSKRAVSFGLPHSSPEIEIHHTATSDSATKNLRRILNLNIDDE